LGFQGLEFKQPRSGSSSSPFQPGPPSSRETLRVFCHHEGARAPACRWNPLYANPQKPPNKGVWYDPKDRARRSHVARGRALLPCADTRCALVFQNTHRFQVDSEWFLAPVNWPWVRNWNSIPPPNPPLRRFFNRKHLQKCNTHARTCISLIKNHGIFSPYNVAMTWYRQPGFTACRPAWSVSKQISHSFNTKRNEAP
jgi:hypothetical protein